MKMSDPIIEKQPASDMAALDALLAEVAAQPVEAPGDDLVARILADAGAVQADAAVAPASVPVTPAWRGWLDALGGWPTLGGLTAAAATGLWIGVAPPAAVHDLVASVIGETVALDLAGLGVSFELEG